MLEIIGNNWENKAKLSHSRNNSACFLVTRSHKRGLKSLGSIRATGEEVGDNRFVFHLLAVPFLFVKTRISFKYQIKLHIVNALTVRANISIKSDKIDLRPFFVRTGDIHISQKKASPNYSGSCIAIRLFSLTQTKLSAFKNNNDNNRRRRRRSQ